MKRVMLVLSFMLISLCIFSQTIIEMTKDGGVYTVPCTINGYKVIQKHYECLFEPCNILITNTIRNGLFLSSNKINLNAKYTLTYFNFVTICISTVYPVYT